MKVEYWIKENSSNQIHILHVDTPIGIFVALHQRATYSPRLFRARLDPHPRQSPTPSISVFSHKIYQHVPAIVPPEMATSPFLKRLSLDAAQRRTIRSEFLFDAGPQCGGWCLKGAGVNPPDELHGEGSHSRIEISDRFAGIYERGSGRANLRGRSTDKLAVTVFVGDLLYRRPQVQGVYCST